MDLTRRDRELRMLYARWLDGASRAGFAISLAAFALYAGAVLPSYLPPEEVARFWALPASRFLEATGAPQGWRWLGLLGHGDALNLAAIALLGLVTPACYARLLPALVAQRDWLQAALALAQLTVLIAAASGLLAGTG